MGQVAQTSSGADSEGPLYAIVARKLKEEIARGTFPVGSTLPTEAALCQRFSVGRHTVREALRQLRDERLVLSRQGAGTLVSPPPAADSFRLEANSINDLVAYATDLHTEIDLTGIERIGSRLAARLGIPSGEEWLVVRGFARSKKLSLPICWSEYYINREFAALGRLLPRHVGPIFRLIEDMFAVTIDEIEQEIAVGTVPAEIAPGLKVEAGTVAIEVLRRFRTTDGKLVQVTLHTHPASRFRETVKMRRIRTSGERKRSSR